jgi:hypothetical protein
VGKNWIVCAYKAGQLYKQSQNMYDIKIDYARKIEEFRD